MMKIFSATVLFLLMNMYAAAQDLRPASADIYLEIKKLKVLGSVLYIAAHPDDENTRLITYFSKEKLYRTGYLSLTRGDGGQNLIGDEQGIELGLIRTQELLSARRIDGGEQFFSRAFDFGFSKTPDETFHKWDREKILSDVVWVIRKFQPDVIITRFPTTGEGGHGHHTASAILANEAFTAAADPTRFKYQLQWVKTWQAKRILWNGFNFNNATPPTGSFNFDVGGFNAILGKSYGEIAAESRSQHKSQGFGSSPQRGEAFEWFKPTGGEPLQADLFDNVVTDWSRIGASRIDRMLDTIISHFDFTHPEYSLAALVRLRKEMRSLPASVWQQKKTGELDALIVACAGIFADATTTVSSVAQSDSLQVSIVVNSRLSADVEWERLAMEDYDTSFRTILLRNVNNFRTIRFVVPATHPVTQPYWLEYDMKEGYYDVRDQQLIGRPDAQPAYTADFTFKIQGETITVSRPVRYRFTDPVKGEIYQPLIVTPVYTLAIAKTITPVFISSGHPETGSRGKKSAFDLIAQRSAAAFDVFENGRQLMHVNNPAKGVHYHFENELTTRITTLDSQVHRYSVNQQGKAAQSIVNIKYDHIPAIAYFKNARNIVVTIPVETEGKEIGYITGAGDRIPDALEEMGYHVTLLGAKDVERMNLSMFDAIITGIRAYNTNEWMNDAYDKLMDYVRDGGNLIVQYNTSNNIGPVRARIGPYPFDITRNRITDENAAVTFIEPGHPLLHFPNEINSDDFKGWIQERSIYHATTRDTSFHSVLRMNDPGESADDGALITARFGKGFFTYTGLVFFRELPAGIPGAYRLVANLIALNRKKAF